MRPSHHLMYGFRFMVDGLLIGGLIGTLAWYTVVLFVGPLVHLWFT